MSKFRYLRGAQLTSNLSSIRLRKHTQDEVKLRRMTQFDVLWQRPPYMGDFTRRYQRRRPLLVIDAGSLRP